MTQSELRELDTEQLHKLSLEKSRKGNASALALRAQKILCERSGVDHKRDRSNTASDDYCYGEPDRFTKRFS